MRHSAPGRLEKIADAALAAFIARGFRQTQMVDAAKRAGVSAGTLYLYAENKDALFELALRRALGRMPEEDALPLKAAGTAATLRWLAEEIPEREGWPLLRAALARAAAPKDGAAEIAGVIGEFFDAVSAQWRLI